VIRDLVAEGATLLLTTQYLEEADQLADDIVVIDHGREIAHGSSDELKTQVGGERIEVTVSELHYVDTAQEILADFTVGEIRIDHHSRGLTAPISGGASTLTQALRELDARGVVVQDVGLRRPTLDDVFLSLTGHVAEEEPAAENGGRKSRRPEELEEVGS
jgi:ABC-2 type transport system ATP-binding protein